MDIKKKLNSLLFYAILMVSMVSALASHHLFHINLLTFASSAVSLILLSKLLGNATEELSHYVGQSLAGFFNVTLSNVAELIIIGVAIKSNLIELVQAGIVGSMIGNLLMVMGLSIFFGCRRHETLEFKAETANLLIYQLFLVAVTLMLPTMFDSSIPEHRHLMFSELLAVLLVGVYIFYWVLSRKDVRLQEAKLQAHEVEHRWSKQGAIITLIVCAVSCFFMSEFLVKEVEHVAQYFNLSQAFIGFIILPLLGNVAEHMVAVFAACKKKTELSLAISVGSASQVGMVIAPFAVVIGLVTGNIVTLDFAGLPVQSLIISIIAAYLVLQDNKWRLSEGIFLLALYLAMAIAFGFTQ